MDFASLALTGVPAAEQLLDRDLPFTTQQAVAAGASRDLLRLWVAEGRLRRLTRGVFVPSAVPDTLELRANAIASVVPPHVVVTDRSAAWLHGVPILARSATQEMPPIQAFSTTGSRSRRPEVDSGIRLLSADDVVDVHGVRATSLLRTSCDLGRLLWRHDALAALDGALRAGVSRFRLQHESQRFRGYRGVRQLRMLIPLADPGAESAPESSLRLWWLDAGLPPPVVQFWVEEDGRAVYRLDIAEPEVQYAAEYDGEQFHGADRADHDRARREWLRERGWTVDVFRKGDLFTPGVDPVPRLQAGYRLARLRQGLSPWGGRRPH